MTLADTIHGLQDQCKVDWPHIIGAVEAARAERTKLEEILKDIILPVDTGLLVFGSLAREEWTVGSDVDWTLLLDGQADSRHLRVVQDIRNALQRAGVKGPGRTSIFGGMAFSHEIIHHIGGEHDTNRNMTRRILLLLESRSIGRTSEGQTDDVRDRVLRGVIERYVEDDLSLVTSPGERARVPRFLLNDIVRFWRTMAVDYASKRREGGDQGWALRNIKLRFSRKLIFVRGLLVCFGAKNVRLFEPLTSAVIDGLSVAERVSQLRSLVELPSLQILAHVAMSYCKEPTICQMFGAYDRFLGILGDPEKRNRLEQLASSAAQSDGLFGEMRDASHQFQESLTELFFRTDAQLTDFSTEYGLF